MKETSLPEECPSSWGSTPTIRLISLPPPPLSPPSPHPSPPHPLLLWITNYFLHSGRRGTYTETDHSIHTLFLENVYSPLLYRWVAAQWGGRGEVRTVGVLILSFFLSVSFGTNPFLFLFFSCTLVRGDVYLYCMTKYYGDRTGREPVFSGTSGV